MRKDRFQVYINKVLDLDTKTKMKILDTLSNVVVITPYRLSEIQGLVDKLNERVSRLKESGSLFKKMDDILKKMNKREQEEVIKTALFMVKKNIESMRKIIGWMMWREEVEEVKDFLIVDQVLLTIRDLLSKVDPRFEGRSKYLIITALWLILRLWAYSRGKLSLDDLESDLSNLKLPPDERFVKEEDYHIITSIIR